jgi:hypothetical protein
MRLLKAVSKEKTLESMFFEGPYAGNSLSAAWLQSAFQVLFTF